MNRIVKPLFVIAFCLLAMLTVNAQGTDEISYRWVSESSASAGIVIRGASDDGKRVVFESVGDYTGQNADGNTEVFVIDVDSGTIIQLTNTANVTDPADSTKILITISCSSPIISGDGTQIVFLSNAPLTAAPNADGNFEVFRATLPARLRDSHVRAYHRHYQQ